MIIKCPANGQHSVEAVHHSLGRLKNHIVTSMTFLISELFFPGPQTMQCIIKQGFSRLNCTDSPGDLKGRF